MQRHSLSRRRMLSRSATTVAALGLSGALGPLLAAEEKRGFKLGVCDWMTPKAGNPEVLGIAAELGLDGVMASFGAPGGKYDLRLTTGASSNATITATSKMVPVAPNQTYTTTGETVEKPLFLALSYQTYFIHSYSCQTFLLLSNSIY
jgi:hypothetical protein